MSTTYLLVNKMIFHSFCGNFCYLPTLINGRLCCEWHFYFELFFFQLAEESAHLAPHGVPGGAMPRALSSSKLEEQDTSAATSEQYGENLNLPGGIY